MGFDRNTVTGFVLLAVLFFGYFWYTSTNQRAAMELKKREQDSLAALRPKIDSIQWRADSVRLARALDSAAAGDLSVAAAGEESLTTVETDLMKLTFSNKGGWLKEIALKNYSGPDSQLVRMGGLTTNVFGYGIATGPNQGTETNKLFFNPAVVTNSPDGSQTISYQVAAPNGKSISHAFVVKPDNYMVSATIDIIGADEMISQQAINLRWTVRANRQQGDVKYERTQSKLVYRTDGDFDYNSAYNGTDKELTKPTDWIGLKQQFFNTTLVTSTPFSRVSAVVTVPADTVLSEVATLTMNASLPVAPGNRVTLPMSIYAGPNDFYILKKYGNDMHNIVDLGSGIFAFVKWINRWLVLPVFEFLTKAMGGKMGWAILMLTIIIRLLIAPLTYTSYLSGAKMKALRPEIEQLKKKFGTDQQAMSVEQMKLFREAGVNPLGGCIPALLQIPIFFALFSFFNSNIDLRGVPFLWANDLSSYDSIYNFGFEIPFYGAHISLFTITACLTSFLISWYSMASTPDTGNPMMKYMPYIFPFMMLFIFNKMPSALTWYYTVSNIITLALQFVIQTYIIDHEKILSQIQANKAKPKSKSKWQERLEAMQETQKKVEDMKKKTQKGK
ncbi:MAG TPA: membrane protein insertase YidC [Phnomibacter sp.]|nr:membrane protein insertase YidC [Phnomibacter sp.]